MMAIVEQPPIIQAQADGTILMQLRFRVDTSAEAAQVAWRNRFFDLWNGTPDDAAILLERELLAEYGDGLNSARCVFALPNRHRLTFESAVSVSAEGGYVVRVNYRSDPDQ